MNAADLVANLLAISDWIDSDEQAGILRAAATALEAARLTDDEREAIEWAMQEAGGVSLRAATLRGLLERTT